MAAGLFLLAIILRMLRPEFLLLVLLPFLIWLAIGAGLSTLFPPDAVPFEDTGGGGLVPRPAAENLWSYVVLAMSVVFLVSFIIVMTLMPQLRLPILLLLVCWRF